MPDIKRPHYFDYQFLIENDFNDEQAYHIAMRRRHNGSMHSWGVAEGFDVTLVGSNEVRVGVGAALDKDGREIVLQDGKNYLLTTVGSNIDVYLTIAYGEIYDPADRYTQGGVDNYTRTTETPVLYDGVAVPPGDGSVILLAKIHLGATGTIESAGAVDMSLRTFAGATLAPQAVQTTHLANGSVTMDKLAANAVDALRIKDGSVNTAELALAAVTTDRITDGAVVESKLGPLAVTEPKIATGAVTELKLGMSAVTEAKIGTGAVTATKIGTGAVTELKIGAGAVTETKIGTSAVTETKIATGAVTDTKIYAGAVTESKIGTAAVTSTKIADGAVSLSKLATNSVDASKIASGSVGYSELADGAVGSAKLGDYAVGPTKLSMWTATHNISVPAYGTQWVGVYSSSGAALNHQILFASVLPTTLDGYVSWYQDALYHASANQKDQYIRIDNRRGYTVACQVKIGVMSWPG